MKAIKNYKKIMCEECEIMISFEEYMRWDILQTVSQVENLHETANKRMGDTPQGHQIFPYVMIDPETNSYPVDPETGCYIYHYIALTFN